MSSSKLIQTYQITDSTLLKMSPSKNARPGSGPITGKPGTKGPPPPGSMSREIAKQFSRLKYRLEPRSNLFECIPA